MKLKLKPQSFPKKVLYRFDVVFNTKSTCTCTKLLAERVLRGPDYKNAGVTGGWTHCKFLPAAPIVVILKYIKSLSKELSKNIYLYHLMPSSF